MALSSSNGDGDTYLFAAVLDKDFYQNAEPALRSGLLGVSYCNNNVSCCWKRNRVEEVQAKPEIVLLS